MPERDEPYEGGSQEDDNPSNLFWITVIISVIGLIVFGLMCVKHSG